MGNKFQLISVSVCSLFSLVFNQSLILSESWWKLKRNIPKKVIALSSKLYFPHQCLLKFFQLIIGVGLLCRLLFDTNQDEKNMCSLPYYPYHVVLSNNIFLCFLSKYNKHTSSFFFLLYFFFPSHNYYPCPVCLTTTSTIVVVVVTWYRNILF